MVKKMSNYSCDLQFSVDEFQSVLDFQDWALITGKCFRISHSDRGCS